MNKVTIQCGSKRTIYLLQNRTVLFVANSFIVKNVENRWISKNNMALD